MVEPSSTAGHLVGIGEIRSCSTRTTRRSAYSANSPGKRIFLAASYGAQWFKFGATTFSMFYDGHTNGNTSFVFCG